MQVQQSELNRIDISSNCVRCEAMLFQVASNLFSQNPCLSVEGLSFMRGELGETLTIYTHGRLPGDPPYILFDNWEL